MQALISYDIVENKTRAAVFKYLSGLGIHSQLSIFEVETDTAMLQTITRRLACLIDKDVDSVIIIPICCRCARKTTVSGRGITLVQTNFVVI